MRLIHIPFRMFLVFSAAGCMFPPPLALSDTTAQKLAIDTQLNESAKRIEELLINLSRAGGISTAKPKGSSSSSNIAVNQEPMTVQWQGDAQKVLRKLAAVRGLKFAVMGRPIRTPVSIQSIDVGFVQVLENIGMQLGNRADVILKTDALEIHYHGI